MHNDFHTAFALQDQQDRIAHATAVRQAREARRHSTPSGSRLRGMWDRVGRPSRVDPLLPEVGASVRPRPPAHGLRRKVRAL